jgi:ElaB/YqjD/DUF883 family membrane-anchored ribosome-binding protein
MLNDKERNEKEEKKADMGKVKWEINSIRDDLKHELEDIHDNLQEVIEDLREEADDIKEDLKEDLEDLMEERNSLLEELGDIKGELEHYGDDKREHIMKAKEKLQRLKKKIEGHEVKFDKKVRKKVEKAVKRINISVDAEMSEDWRDWADGLGASVSELVRKSMKFVKNNIGDIAKLEQWGHKMEKMGEKIERAVENSGIEDLGRDLDRKFGKQVRKPKVGKSQYDEQKERIKKRIQGLIKLQKSLPIGKLSQAINISKEEAENIIYELAAEGIEGDLDLEAGVFKFTSTPEEVISKLNDVIDKL